MVEAMFCEPAALGEIFRPISVRGVRFTHPMVALAHRDFGRLFGCARSRW